MILATDVQYHDQGATVAGVLFHDWKDANAEKVIMTEIQDVAPYVSGQFYQRELPCLLALLEDVGDAVECIVVDGFVYLDGEQKPGLGKYLYDALDGQIPVIGVAKSAFKDSPPDTALLRGNSQNPLYVTSVGIPFMQAKHYTSSIFHSHHCCCVWKL